MITPFNSTVLFLHCNPWYGCLKLTWITPDITLPDELTFLRIALSLFSSWQNLNSKTPPSSLLSPTLMVTRRWQIPPFPYFHYSLFRSFIFYFTTISNFKIPFFNSSSMLSITLTSSIKFQKVFRFYEAHNLGTKCIRKVKLPSSNYRFCKMALS